MLIEMLAAWASQPSETFQVPGQSVRELLGTASLIHEVRRDRGGIVACETVFRVLAEDNLYANGGLITLDGSLNLHSTEGGYFGSIKISGRDVFISGERPITVPYESDYGYFLSTDTGEPYPVSTSFQCEDGGYCAAVDVDTIINMLSEFIVHGSLQGALNRTGGNTDLPFIIEATQSEWNAEEFLECARRLMSPVDQ
jgi:hypothetical protein